ncbi:hypothetical protein D9O50_10020 [Oxalobacteraceae bacterium CAVE-383]|nr:hypothetical protein D9O50_10020 [Oxalobacteraceae bacterium CAVE-383]
MFLQNNKEMTALYWQCVDERFVAETVEDTCANLLHGAGEVMSRSGSLVERIVDFLDIKIGAMYRVLVDACPELAVKNPKRFFVAEIFCGFYRQMDLLLADMLRAEGIHRDDAAQMFLAAAVGISQMSEGDEGVYRARLSLIVETLIAGL